jgi:hypothetical protein
MELERPAKSALIKLLRGAGRAKPRSLGFGRGRDEDKPAAAMVLVAQVDGLDAAAAKAAIAAGAAAVAFTVGPEAVGGLAEGSSALREAIQACGEAVPGLVFGPDAELTGDMPERFAAAKVDFVVAPVQRTPAAFLTAESIAKVPSVDASQPAALIRALGDMDVDALCVSPPRRRRNAAELTVYDMMHYKGVAELARPPIMVLAEQAIHPGDLQALRDVGVDGIVLPVAKLGDDAAERITAFRDAIAKVKVQRKRSGADDGGNVFLPRVGPATTASADEGDEEDDD